MITQKQASEQMMRFITARWISEPIFVAVKLGIADFIENGKKSIKDIAIETDCLEANLYRLMRALASVGIFEEISERFFRNTNLSNCLKQEVMGNIIIFFLSDWHKQAWDNLFQSFKTGKTAFELAHGIPAFEWLKNNPKEAEIFNQANAGKIQRSHQSFINSYDFSSFNSITDVGGGNGALLIEIIKANPHIQGVVADLPHLLDEATSCIKEYEFEDVCKFVPCNFFDKIPESELYILCNILHDWEDEKSKVILDNCSKNMKQDMKLLIIEMIVPSGNEPSVAKLLDMEMLVMGGGRERTFEEYEHLLKGSGLKINRIIETGANDKIMECVCI